MRNLALAGSMLAVSPFVSAQAPADESPAPSSIVTKAALREFREASGGRWIVRWHPATGTPSTIYGTGLKLPDWRENSLDEARRQAAQLLDERRDMLGLGTSDFREVIGARMGRTWSLTYEQWFRGLPVIDGRVDVRINMTGVVSMLGSRAWPIAKDFVTMPTIGAELAQATAWAAPGHRGGQREPGDGAGGARLGGRGAGGRRRGPHRPLLHPRAHR